MGYAPQQARTRRWGAGTAAVIRSLIRQQRPVSGSQLARLNGISQPRVVQILRLLDDRGALTRADTGVIGDRDRLFDLYLTHTAPTIHSESFWYSPSGLLAQAQAISERTWGTPVGFSADVGCDLIAPWRNPTVALFYCAEPIEIDSRQFVKAASLNDATLVVRVVNDRTLYSSSSRPSEWAWIQEPQGIPIIDPIQQWQDLLILNGDDRKEAAGVLQSVILQDTPRP